MNVMDFKRLADQVFVAIRKEAQNEGIKQGGIAVSFDILGTYMASEMNEELDERFVFTSSLVVGHDDDESFTQVARGSIDSAKLAYEANYKYKPSDKIEDFSSETHSGTPGGIYIPAGLVFGGCPRTWYNQAGVGIAVATQDSGIDKHLAMFGAPIVCDRFAEWKYLTPEIFHSK